MSTEITSDLVLLNTKRRPRVGDIVYRRTDGFGNVKMELSTGQYEVKIIGAPLSYTYGTYEEFIDFDWAVVVASDVPVEGVQSIDNYLKSMAYEIDKKNAG